MEIVKQELHITFQKKFILRKGGVVVDLSELYISPEDHWEHLFCKSDSFIIFMHEKLFGQNINCAKVTVLLYSSLKDCLVRMTSTFWTSLFL